MLSRYSNIDYILKLPHLQGIEFTNKASQERQKERLFSIWLSKYPYMTDKTFVPFEQFFEQCAPQKAVLPKRTTEEILSEAHEFRKSLGKEW